MAKNKKKTVVAHISQGDIKKMQMTIYRRRNYTLCEKNYVAELKRSIEKIPLTDLCTNVVSRRFENCKLAFSIGGERAGLQPLVVGPSGVFTRCSI